MTQIAKRRLHSLIVLLTLLLALILFLIPATAWSHKTVDGLANRHNSRMSPVIFIPGSSANVDRFDELITRLNAQATTKHSVLKITVDTNDHMVITGRIRPRDQEPFIVVGFQNNHDGYDNIKKQAKWFSLAFDMLSKRYLFNNFKAVGHSNGGLIYTYFLEHDFNSSAVTMKRLMALGSPFNFSESSLAHKTQMLSDFIANRRKIPKTLSVFSVAGAKTYTSDGIVPEQSVEAGKYIFQGQAAHYTQMTVTGSEAEHSDLPQNPETVTLMRQYILDSPDANGRPQTGPDRTSGPANTPN